MKEACFIFPGQGGPVKPGIEKTLYDKYEETRHIFDKGKEILGDEILGDKTINAQPRILLINLAYFEILKQRLQCVSALGNSAGKSSALYAAGCLNLEDVIRFTKKRDEFMGQSIEEVVKAEKQAEMEFGITINPKITHMAAIMTKEVDLVSELCKFSSIPYSDKGIVEISNINPGQVVISGNRLAVEELVDYFKKETEIKTTPLPVKGPFHSILMKSAENKMRIALGKGGELENININPPDPKILYIANSTGMPIDHTSTPEQIRDLLINQICGKVKWKKSLETAIKRRYRNYIECGLGRIHSNMLKRHYKSHGIEVLDIKDYL